MAIANSYPVGTVKTEDLVLGTSIPLAGTNDKPVTKNFSVGDIVGLAPGSSIISSKVAITGERLSTISTNALKIIEAPVGSPNEIIELISVTVKSDLNPATDGSSINYFADLVITPAFAPPLGPSWQYNISQNWLDSVTSNFTAYRSTLSAGTTSTEDRDIYLGDTGGVDPTVSGDNIPGITLYLTYRIINTEA
jgi:hypothetical protein